MEALKQFHHYLYGTYDCRTDHGALNWLRNFKNPEGQVARWLEVLGTYPLEISLGQGASTGTRMLYPGNHA